MQCPHCDALVPAHVRHCVGCQKDVGWPNVRAADEEIEKRALEVRLENARRASAALSCLAALEDFGLAVLSSKAVVARSLGDLHSFLQRENELYISFHQQVRAGMRIPKDNDWDRGRAAAEATIHPNYYEQIWYAALSLDGRGDAAYGAYSITLKDPLIAHRTSVFEENPFKFCQRHRVAAGQPAPPGYRATWDRRDKLAMAKLGARINATTSKDQYPGILLEPGKSTGDGDFIEAHIYGPLHRTAVERVVGRRPSSRLDQVIWKSALKILRILGASVEEV